MKLNIQQQKDPTHQKPSYVFVQQREWGLKKKKMGRKKKLLNNIFNF